MFNIDLEKTIYHVHPEEESTQLPDIQKSFLEQWPWRLMNVWQSRRWQRGVRSPRYFSYSHEECRGLLQHPFSIPVLGLPKTMLSKDCIFCKKPGSEENPLNLKSQGTHVNEVPEKNLLATAPPAVINSSKLSHAASCIAPTRMNWDMMLLQED